MTQIMKYKSKQIFCKQTMTQIMKYKSKQIFNVNNDTNHEI